MTKKTLKDVEFSNKTVLARFDFNVPLDENNNITDDTRIKAALPTIKHILEHGGKLVMLSHLGRIKTEADKNRNSLAVVAERLSNILKLPVIFIDETRGTKLENAIHNLNQKSLLLVENTRFEDLDGQKESKNDPALGKYWASLGDIFVNDAFGTAHRAHASNVGIATYITESCVGFLIEKELTMLDHLLQNPARPFIAIMGGAKVSDKIDVIKNLLQIADKVLIGGGMAYTFKAALGKKVGTSPIETNKLDLARELLASAQGKLLLPLDFVVGKEFKDLPGTNTEDDNIPDDEMGLDIGVNTRKYFKEQLIGAKTIFWNGPVGVFEMSHYMAGTKSICKAIADLPHVFSVIGGGDSAAAAVKFKYDHAFSHISTGGGASLEYLEGKNLPGIAAISNQ